jgi:hypothetical protein
MTVEVISTVVSGVSSYDLVDLSTVKDELEIDASDSSRDTIIQRYIGQVSTSIRSRIATGCSTSRRSATKFISSRTLPVHGAGRGPVLQLSRWPVTRLASVTLASRTAARRRSPTGTDFKINKDLRPAAPAECDGIMVTWAALSRSRSNTTRASSISLSDVVVAALRWIVLRWSERSRDPMLKAEQTPLGGTKSFWVGGPPMSGGVPQEIASLLDSYRQPVAF